MYIRQRRREAGSGRDRKLRWGRSVCCGVLAVSIVAAACAPTSKDMGRASIEGDTSSNFAGQASSGSDTVSQVTEKRPVVLFIGTSLTVGYGLEESQAYPAVIERIADSVGLPITAVNAGVSGETSAGALRRVEWALRSPADIVVLETGANDGLRGQPVSSLRQNIEEIVGKVRASKPDIPIVLVQMEAPPNLGATYVSQFHSVYPDIARRLNLDLAPFLLDGVAGVRTLNQADGIHPNEAGAEIVAKNVWRSLGKVVQSVK